MLSRAPALVTLASTLDLVNRSKQNGIDMLASKSAAIMRDIPQSYSAEESASLDELRDTFEALDLSRLKPRKPPHPLVKASGMGGIAVTSTVMDDSIENIAAYIFCISNEDQDVASDVSVNSIVRTSDHHSTMNVEFSLPFPCTRKKLELTKLWRKIEGADGARARIEVVKIIKAGMLSLKILFLLENDTQDTSTATIKTRVTCLTLQNYDYALRIFQLANRIPVTSFAGDFVNVTRIRFDRSSDIDRLVRQREMSTITNCSDLYSDEDNAIVADGVRCISRLQTLRSKPVKLASPLTLARRSTGSGEGTIKSYTSRAWGWSKTKVQAGALEILSYLRSFRGHSARDLRCLEEIGGHSRILYRYLKSPTPLISSRYYLFRTIWKKLRDGQYVIVTIPCDPPAGFELPKDAVKGEYPSITVLTSLNDRETEVVYVCNPGVGGDIPVWFFNIYMGYSLAFVTEVQEYFISVKGLKDWGVEDGRQIAEALVIKAKRHWIYEDMRPGLTFGAMRMQTMLASYKGFKEASVKYPFFSSLLASALDNKMGFSGNVGTKLCNVTPNEGRLMGTGFSRFIFSNSSPEVATDVWISRYPALEALDSEEVWFRPMMEVLANRLSSKLSFENELQFLSAATVGFFTTLNTGLVFWALRNRGSATLTLCSNAIFGFLVLSMVVRCLVLIVQHWRRPLRMARELLLSFLGLGVFRDWYKVYLLFIDLPLTTVPDDEEVEKFGPLLPWFEYFILFSARLFLSVMPCAVIQVVVIFDFEFTEGLIPPNICLVGVLISALSVGVTHMIHATECDLDSQVIEWGRHLFNCVPDAVPPFFVRFFLVVNTATMFIIRCLLLCFLFYSSPTLMAMCIAAEIAFFVGIKWFRNDITHWYWRRPLLIRLQTKVLVDFSANIAFRAASSLGGLNWMMSVLGNIVGLPTSVKVFEVVRNQQVKSSVWTLVFVLCGVWVCNFTALLVFLKPEFARSFLKLQTCSERTQELFMDADKLETNPDVVDEQKARIILKNPAAWLPIREEVKRWVLANYLQWDVQRPAWFTDSWRAALDDDMIPREEFRELEPNSSPLFSDLPQSNHSTNPTLNTMNLLALAREGWLARRALAEAIENPSTPYSPTENDLLKAGLSRLKEFVELKSTSVKNVRMSSPLSTGLSCHLPGEHTVTMYAKTIIRAQPTHAIAYYFHTNSYENRSDNDVENFVAETADSNEHCKIQYKRRTNGFGLSDREFLNRIIYKKLDADTYLLISLPTEIEGRPLLPAVVRASAHVVLKATRLRDDETQIEYLLQVDPGGCIPTFVNKRFIPQFLAYVDTLRDNFQATRSLDVWDGEGDGIAVGHLLTTPTDFEKIKSMRSRHVSVAERRTGFLFTNNQGLADIQARYAFFKPMVSAMLLNEWSTPVVVNVALEAVTPDSGDKIGGTLTYFLLTNPTAQAAIDKWVAKFPALTELAAVEPWFRPMVVTMAQNIMDEIPFALKLKLFIAAALSIGDMASDVSVIFAYWALGEYFYAYVLIAMLFMCLLIQVALVYAQNGGAPRGVILREIFYVLTLVKPGVESMRCARKEERSEYSSLSALSELAASKTIEMVCESIPGSILQTLVLLRILLRGGGVSKTAVTSLLISALTTSFSSTLISFNYDVDPDLRATEPDFYGYISNEPVAQTMIFLTMMLNSTLVVIMKSFSAALIIIVGSKYYAWYLILDMALYFLQKALRNDLWYWPPVYGVKGILFAVLGRALPKIVVDFTAITQFRGPGEMGGIYWTINLALAVLIALASVPFYFAFANTDSDVNVLDERTTYAIMSGLCLAFVVNFAYFVYQMEPKYRRTFFSFETAVMWVRSYFLKGATDDARVRIVICNKNQWKSIRPEVIEWFHESWAGWEVEKPKFFTAAFKKRLDDDLVPPDAPMASVVNVKNDDGSRMSSSVENGLVGEKRDSRAIVPVNDCHQLKSKSATS
jgi:hypothetical protein